MLTNGLRAHHSKTALDPAYRALTPVGILPQGLGILGIFARRVIHQPPGGAQMRWCLLSNWGKAQQCQPLITPGQRDSYIGLVTNMPGVDSPLVRASGAESMAFAPTPPQQQSPPQCLGPAQWGGPKGEGWRVSLACPHPTAVAPVPWGEPGSPLQALQPCRAAWLACLSVLALALQPDPRHTGPRTHLEPSCDPLVGHDSPFGRRCPGGQCGFFLNCSSPAVPQTCW